MSRGANPYDSQAGDLVLTLTDIDHLFIAPGISPMSPGPAEVLGISGIDYLLPILQFDSRRQRAGEVLITLLEESPRPSADLAAPAEETPRSLHRYAKCRIGHLSTELRNTYRDGRRILGRAIIVLIICLGLSTLFGSDIAAGLRPLLRTTLQYGFEVIGWVVLWHPIDLLVSAPRIVRFRITALQTLTSLNVVIRTDQSVARC